MNILWSPEAIEDLNSLRAYIAQDNPSAARAVALHIAHSIEQLLSTSLEPIPLVFWRSAAGREPVREWLNGLPREDKRVIGRDIAKVQFGWPIGLPLCRPLSGAVMGSALGAAE